MATQPVLVRIVLVALAAVVALAPPALAQTATVTFLHLNDVYEISPKQGWGGFAPLMTLLRRERAAAPDAITTLGRDVNNAIVVEDPFASGEHAVLTYRGRGWYVEDLGSTNGTFVSDQALERGRKHELRDGDSIRFGGFTAIIKIV